MRSISGVNVLEVVAIADKYQNEPLIRKCKKVMLSWLEDCKTEPPDSDVSEQGQYTLSALQILKKSIEIGYEEIKNEAADAVSRFSSRIYTIFPSVVQPVKAAVKKSSRASSGFTFGSTNTVAVGNPLSISQAKAINVKCQQLFADLPREVQNDVLKKRLIYVENHRFISD